MERRGPENNLGKYWLLLYPSPTGTINLQIEAGISTGAPLGGPGAPAGVSVKGLKILAEASSNSQGHRREFNRQGRAGTNHWEMKKYETLVEVRNYFSWQQFIPELF